MSFAATDPTPETLAILGARHPGNPLERARRAFRSVADGRYHYLRDDTGTEWLFDLERDPRASRNRAAELPDECVRLRALLHEAHPGW